MAFARHVAEFGRNSLSGGVGAVQAFHPEMWRFLAYAVIVSSSFNGALGKAFGYLSVRPDWCLAGMAALALLATGPWRLPDAWRSQLRNPVAIALMVFVTAHVVASVANAGGWPSGLKFMNVYVLGLAAFLAVLHGIRSRRVFEVAVRLLISVGVIASVWGGLAAISSNLGQRMIVGAEPILYLNGLVIYAGRGGLLEPNILGSFLLVPSALALWSWSDAPSSRFPFRAASLMIVFGLVASQTRAAWLGGTAIVLVWLWHRRPPFTAFAALAVVAALSVLALQASLWPSTRPVPPPPLASPSAGPPTAESANPFQLRAINPLIRRFDYNLLVRWRINEAVFNNWRESGPVGWLLGRGSGSTNGIDVVLNINNQPRRLPLLWTGNAFLINLHDAGVVGLVAFAALLATVAYQLRSMLHRARRGRDRGLCWALVISAVALLFAYQFTHALWQMWTYVFLGLVVAACRLLEMDAEPAPS
jgi:hypothetical protein